MVIIKLIRFIDSLFEFYLYIESVLIVITIEVMVFVIFIRPVSRFYAILEVSHIF